MSAGGHGEGHGAQSERQFGDIIKVMELRGLMRNFTEEKANQMGDLFVRNYAASGGQVNPSAFLAMFKTGGVAAKLVNDDFLYALGHVMQEKGGSRVGNALMSTYQNLIAGRVLSSQWIHPDRKQGDRNIFPLMWERLARQQEHNFQPLFEDYKARHSNQVRQSARPGAQAEKARYLKECLHS